MTLTFFKKINHILKDLHKMLGIQSSSTSLRDACTLSSRSRGSALCSSRAPICKHEAPASSPAPSSGEPEGELQTWLCRHLTRPRHATLSPPVSSFPARNKQSASRLETPNVEDARIPKKRTNAKDQALLASSPN